MRFIQPTIIGAAMSVILLCASCGTMNHKLTAGEMEERLRADTRMIADGPPEFMWSYAGSTSDCHCFRRTTMRIFVTGMHDGNYCIPRSSLELSSLEYPHGVEQSPVRGIFAFTAYDTYGRPKAYSMKYGVFEGWGNGPRWTEAQSGPRE
jgi:hypothetical protein